MTAGHFYHLAGRPANVQTAVTNGMGDGVPESQASFDTLSGVSVDSDGNVVLADLTRVRVIAAPRHLLRNAHDSRRRVHDRGRIQEALAALTDRGGVVRR